MNIFKFLTFGCNTRAQTINTTLGCMNVTLRHPEDSDVVDYSLEIAVPVYVCLYDDPTSYLFYTFECFVLPPSFVTSVGRVPIKQ
jgi:hypothetical protein